MDVFDNIKTIAAERGMTLKEVSNKAGIGENSIYRWRSSNPSTNSLKKVADVLSVPIETLLSSPSKEETPAYQAIQRRAKQMTPEEQQKLLKLIELTFKKY